MKRVLIISDTHYPKKTIDPIFFDLVEEADIIIHCGDLEEFELLEELENFNKPVYAVRGNNYDYLLQNRLNDKMIISIEDIIIGITHGNGLSGSPLINARHSFKKDEVDIICYGHSHVLEITRENNIQYINPGSFTSSRKGENSYIFLLVEGNDFTINKNYIK